MPWRRAFSRRKRMRRSPKTSGSASGSGSGRRSGAGGSPMRSRVLPSSSPRRRRPTSPATRSWSMAGISRIFERSAKNLPCRQDMTDERQFAELMRHVHAVADDEFVRADEAPVIGFDIGSEMARLLEEHRGRDA